MALCGGCRQEMADQPWYAPLAESEFFADGRSARPLPPGAVARGQLHSDRWLWSGEPAAAEGDPAVRLVAYAPRPNLAASNYAGEFPFAISAEDLGRGRERFKVFCVLCHDPLGHGDGIVVRRGFTRPPSYHDEPLRSAPVGYYFSVITRGFGSMPDYAAQVPVRDRWAIAAYIRALQWSQSVRLADLPPAQRQSVLKQLEPSRADAP